MALLTFNIPARSMTVMNFSCLAIAFTPDYCSLRIFADRPLCFSRCQRSRRSDRYPCLNQPIPVVHIGSPQKIFGTKMVTDAHAGRVLSTCSTRGPSCWPSYFASSGPGAVSPPRDPEFCKSPSAGADETPKILEISSSTTRSCPGPGSFSPWEIQRHLVLSRQERRRRLWDYFDASGRRTLRIFGTRGGIPKNLVYQLIRGLILKNIAHFSPSRLVNRLPFAFVGSDMAICRQLSCCHCQSCQS